MSGLWKKKGFSIEDMGRVTKYIIEIQLEKLSVFHVMQFDKKLEELTTLNLFMFSVEEIIKKTSLEKEIIQNIIQAFECSNNGIDNNFNTLDDFNISNAYPLISVDKDNYVLFQHYSLL